MNLVRMNFGKVTFIEPNHNLLKRYIKGYYTHESDHPDFSTRLIFYRNITCTVSIFHDVNIELEKHKWKERHNVGMGVHAAVMYRSQLRQIVEINGIYRRFAIVFYPLGINHFIPSSLASIGTEPINPFNIYNSELADIGQELFSNTNIIEKRELIEDFLLSSISHFSQDKLISAVNILLNSPVVPKVNELAKKIGIHRRSLLRLFKNHLGYSIEDYINTIKFRRALDHYKGELSPIRFTDVAYNSGYYDQPDFNHHVKSRSGLSPKELFTSIEKVDNVLFWNSN